ncbi:hypothetical protein QUW57_05750 [Phocaeicola plebeius]|uniref:CIS tube protein n=1 Tax=Phocaeicola plebeius TaxID=310297 RepID=UPI0020567743|nr:hypothetical protein [Phocaeicola plebeius]MCR8882502.1 hypothetical protein [Phocaeicola plebeius]MDM8286084.1 hypothetical protein [Phocaeicola plebeius]DAE81260.1 MAG TPA: secretion system protein [Caudoviricetes sp.]DAQ44161.1 MAG TPA: secretion system protein [Bacteriophage sp.]
MQTIKISAYTDKDFSQQHGSALELPMEPEQISFGNSIHYRDDRQLGSTGGDIRFEKYGPATLSLKFTIDCTGVVEGTLPGDSVYDKVNDLADLLYVYNSDGHSPSYVVVTYGELLFKGRLEKMDTKYQLFSSGGVPLRATVSLVFKRFMTGKEERKKFSKQSPDMSRLVTVKEGETLPYLCHRLYGDSLLVREVARFNELDSFRNIPAGTQLLFPPLKKN